jgi:hypothetical protein
MSIELAVREWARRDARRRPSSRRSIPGASNATRKLFVALGVVGSRVAKSRSLLLYAYVFGQSLMACETL